MSRLSIGQKAPRVLRFIEGIGHPEVFSAMTRYGFSHELLEEGFRRLRRFTRMRYERTRPGEPDPAITKAVDELENKWFPIAKLTLEANYPDVAKRVFLNLSQLNGPQVVLSMDTLLQRIRMMERGEGELATEGPAARALLAERGLTDAVVQHAEELVAQMSVPRDFSPGPAPAEADLAAAEAELWAWYKEWSGIARVVVTERNLLRKMGFLGTRRTSGEAGDEAADDDMEDGTEPADAVDPTEPAVDAASPVAAGVAGGSKEAGQAAE